MKPIRTALALCLALSGALATALASPPPLPLEIPEGSWAPLLHWQDEALESIFRGLLRADPARARLIDRELLTVGLVDLSDPREPRFAAVNGDTMLYAASLPKIGILWGAHMAIEQGLVEDTPELRGLMTRMLRVSSNLAATSVYDLVGFPTIAQSLQDPRYRLYDPRRGGGLWVGKRYAKGGGRHGDPLRNISHAATATQVCRFYYLLATGHGLSPQRSREMLGHLADPGIRHHFVGVLRRIAPQARLYRKSGTWSRWASDSVLVWGPSRRYILVGLAEAGELGKKLLPALVPLAEKALAQPRIARLPGPEGS